MEKYYNGFAWAIHRLRQTVESEWRKICCLSCAKALMKNEEQLEMYWGSGYALVELA